jgi:hypothetical protein
MLAPTSTVQVGLTIQIRGVMLQDNALPVKTTRVCRWADSSNSPKHIMSSDTTDSGSDPTTSESS